MKIKGRLLHEMRLDGAEEINAALRRRYEEVKGGEAVRRSHFFHGRFENTYLPMEVIPQLAPVAAAAPDFAQRLLGERLRYGFWFNEMGPGCCTSLHHHDELDERLSGCYYITVPEASGRFVAVEGGRRIPVTPTEGRMLFFSPALPHEVEENRSGQTRLSVAFNFGPRTGP